MINNEELHSIIREVSEVLTFLDIPPHFTGWIAASFYGEPRLTQDIDVVILLLPDSNKVGLLERALSKIFDINKPAICDAVARNSIFQALH